MMCPNFYYEFAFAVLIEEIKIRLILPESLLNFEYISALIRRKRFYQ